MVAEARPLAGRRIVVTRPEHQADEMVATLRQLGAEPVEIPAIRIQPKADLSALDEALRHVERYQWLVFTSTNGVRIALDRLEELGLDLGRLANSRIAAIGPATAGSLRERGLEANFVPESFVAEEVAADLPEVDGARVLLPRAAGARAVLPEQLEARGAVVDEIAIYESVPADVNPRDIELLSTRLDAITFTSSSTAKFFTQSLRNAGLDPLTLPGDPLIACIGPITADSAREMGYRIGLIAQRYTSAGLVEALANHFRKEVANGHR